MVFDVKKLNWVGSSLVGLWVYFREKSLGVAKIPVFRTMLSLKICELVSTPGVLVNFN